MAIPMPGPYQVSQTIQDILQRRRDESRQAMIDKLNLDQTQHSMRVADENLALNKSQEERAANLQLESILSQRLGNVGDTTDPKSLSPDLYQYAKGIGRIQPIAPATPKVTTTTMTAPPEGATPAELEEYARSLEAQPPQSETTGGAQIPAGERFIGRPEYEKEQRARGYFDQLIASRPELAQNKELMTALAIQQAGGQVPERLLGDRNAYIYDHKGNRTATQPLGPYDEVVQTPQPYQMPTWGAPKPYQEIEARTGRVVRSHSLDQTQYAMLAEQLAPQGHVLVASTAPFAPLQAADRAKDIAARQFGAAFTSNAPRAQRTAELNQARTALIYETNVSNPEILTALNLASERILAAVDRNGEVPADTVQRVVQTIRTRYPQMSEDDVAEVSETLNLLLTNIPKAEPQAAQPPPVRPAAPIVQQPRTPVRRDPVRR